MSVCLSVCASLHVCVFVQRAHVCACFCARAHVHVCAARACIQQPHAHIHARKQVHKPATIKRIRKSQIGQNYKEKPISKFRNWSPEPAKGSWQPSYRGRPPRRSPGGALKSMGNLSSLPGENILETSIKSLAPVRNIGLCTTRILMSKIAECIHFCVCSIVPFGLHL